MLSGIFKKTLSEEKAKEKSKAAAQKALIDVFGR